MIRVVCGRYAPKDAVAKACQRRAKKCGLGPTQWRREGGARAQSFTIRMLTQPEESAEKVSSDDGAYSVDSIPLPRGRSEELRYYRDARSQERVVAARTDIAADTLRSAFAVAEWGAVPCDGVVQCIFFSGIAPAQLYDDAAAEAALAGWEAANASVQGALAQPPRAPARGRRRGQSG